MRDSMIFYRSFYEAIQDLPDAEALQVYNAIFSYGLNFEEPELTGTASTVFKLIKPQLIANIRKYENSLKGGRPKSGKESLPLDEEETKMKPKENQNETKSKANGNGNGNLNKNPNSNLNSPEPVEPVEFLERASDELFQERIDEFHEILNESIFKETKQKSVIDDSVTKKPVSDLSPQMLQLIEKLNDKL
jgi:hypothetical protein